MGGKDLVGLGDGGRGTLHLNKLHDEDKGGVGRDSAGGTAGAVGDVGGEGDLPPIALAHQLEGLGPALDNLIGGEVDGGAAGVGGVEYLAGDELALVVAGAGGSELGAGGADALVKDLEQEAGGELVDAGLLLLVEQKLG